MAKSTHKERRRILYWVHDKDVPQSRWYLLVDINSREMPPKKLNENVVIQSYTKVAPAKLRSQRISARLEDFVWLLDSSRLI
jgi:hypothetical protein